MQLFEANKFGALGTLIRDRVEGSLGDFSTSAAAVLSMLHFKPGLMTSELAAIVGVSQPTAVRLIDGLVQRALIERGATIGRVTPLRLTEAGHREAQGLQARRLAALDDLLGALRSEERRLFVSLLDVVLADATTSRAFAKTTCRLCEHDLCGADICPIGCRATEIEGGENRP